MSCEFHQCHHHDSCIVHVPMFEGLCEPEISLLTNAVHSRHYRKGEFVFREGDSSDALYVINRGVVKVSKLADSGKEHILRFLFHGDFGGMSAMFREGYHYANAQVIEEAIVCRIFRDDLKAILNHNPNMAYRFLVALSGRLREADEWAGSISLMDAERRLAKTLLIFRDKVDASGGQLPVSKRDLAALMGVTPETLSRKLAELEGRGIVSLQGKAGIDILNVDALEEMVGELYTSN